MATPTVVRDLEGKVALITGATSGIGKPAVGATGRAGGHGDRARATEFIKPPHNH
jgi:NAD(P)-dependent dehydrogenase (short-subunit alcohol dehydrogenase family)